MTATHFVDTNVLLYAASRDPGDATKRKVAEQILRLPGVGFSAQVMQEFYHVAHRRNVLGITHEEAMAVLAAIARRPVQPITSQLVLSASQISREHQLSYWDAAIVAAAHSLGCHTLYTEDPSHGQRILEVEIENPFAEL